ncbi:MAG: type III pantothenate kinase [Clostridia bacterium]|nr:type III pantothenate kinase [Clostridia bacterium]
MLFAVDIGNTNIHVGVFEGEALQSRFLLGSSPCRTADEYAMLMKALLREKGIDAALIDGVVLGSVAPSVTPAVQAALGTLFALPVTVIGPGVKTGFPIRLDDPAELGADLVANAAGVLATRGAPAVILDFGTATTVIALDEKGALQGGAILPGVGMSLQALGNAELLPGVPVDGSVAVLGKNTPDCMRAGVIRGGAMAAAGLAEHYKKLLHLPAKTPLVVSGGFAKAILPYLPAEADHAPDLTLRGLAAIYRLNRKS